MQLNCTTVYNTCIKYYFLPFNSKDILPEMQISLVLDFLFILNFQSVHRSQLLSLKHMNEDDL